jgi:hypothetical protein
LNLICPFLCNRCIWESIDETKEWAGNEEITLELDIDQGMIFFSRSGQEKAKKIIFRNISSKGDYFFPALSCSGNCEVLYDLNGCLNDYARLKVIPHKAANTYT